MRNRFGSQAMKLSKTLKYLNIKNIHDAYKDIVGEYDPGKIIGKVRPFIHQNAHKLLDEWKLAKEKLKDIPGTNYELGLFHLKKGNLQDAILRFRMVIFLTPDNADAYYNLGRCLVEIGDNTNAETALTKALSLKPNFAEVAYIMGKLHKPEALLAIPDNVIAEKILWRSAPSTEEIEARHQADQALVTAALVNINDKNPNLEVLDLGCGTGGRGAILRSKEVLKNIIGIDLDTQSSSHAKSRKHHGDAVYNSVEEIEISKHLSGNKKKFDAIFAGNVFLFVGKLSNIFTSIAKALTKDGVFVILADKTVNEPAGYRLDITKDIFLHSAEYIEATLKESGFIVADKKDKTIGSREFYIITAKRASLQSCI